MKNCVEKFVESCHDCQVVSTALPNPTPLKMTEIPAESWLMVGCDLCGPFPSGESLLVCVDYHSRYPEAEIVRSVKTAVIADRLRKMFCRYGPPETLVTDNGPQFTSAEFKELMSEFNIQHRRVTPYHPIANGEVERFNRCLKKCIQTAISEGINWRTALQTFLLNYRTTPHSTTGVPPSELFFGRRIRDKLPTIQKPEVSAQGSVSVRDSAKKQAMKSYADSKRKAAHHSITVGQQVLITNNKPHRNKYTPRWLPTPGLVTEVKGNGIFIAYKNKNIMRSSTQVKPYHTTTAANPSMHPAESTLDNSSDSESDISIDATNVAVLPNDNASADDINSDATIPYDIAHPDESDVTADEDEDLFNPLPQREVRQRRQPPRYKDYVCQSK